MANDTKDKEVQTPPAQAPLPPVQPRQDDQSKDADKGTVNKDGSINK